MASSQRQLRQQALTAVAGEGQARHPVIQSIYIPNHRRPDPPRQQRPVRARRLHLASLPLLHSRRWPAQLPLHHHQRNPQQRQRMTAKAGEGTARPSCHRLRLSRSTRRDRQPRRGAKDGATTSGSRQRFLHRCLPSAMRLVGRSGSTTTRTRRRDGVEGMRSRAGAYQAKRELLGKEKVRRAGRARPRRA